MKPVLTIIDERASLLVALGGAILNVIVAFGAPLTIEQLGSLDVLLFTTVAFLANRDIGTARRLPPA
jgi:hypothetical protein